MVCNKCGNKMIIRYGKYGFFGSCSNYPNCKNNIKLSEFMYEILKKEQLNIYSWKKECWKCHKLVPVYTYMIGKQMVPYMQQTYQIGNIGLGSIKKIDNYLIKNFPSINDNYSKTLSKTCASNNCIYCGALQGNNFVVDDPHEIYDDWLRGGMDKYIVKKIDINDIGLTENDLEGNQNNIVQIC